MKYSRHSKIIELIDKYDIETQQELAKLLKENGFEVTQATVSRDIKELRLVKILGNNGKYKYSNSAENDQLISDRFLKILKDAVIDVSYAKNILVVKTLVGSANAAAAAIDALKLDHIVGTIAGDDTIFILLKTEKEVFELKETIEEMLE
ncbi:MAG: arginine repressor [Bacillota bacterium]